MKELVSALTGRGFVPRQSTRQGAAVQELKGLSKRSLADLRTYGPTMFPIALSMRSSLHLSLIVSSKGEENLGQRSKHANGFATKQMTWGLGERARISI